MGENYKNKVLYNGIVLPDEWPPKKIEENLPEKAEKGLIEPQDVPYLKNPPEVIKIDVGRQLFVDDFLIDSTTLERAFGKPEIHPSSPVLIPLTQEEMDNGNCPMAAPFNDGCWYDSKDKLFKMWYMAGWFHNTALVISHDGLHWERPILDVVKGTNLVWPPKHSYERDGCLVWLDSETSDVSQRYKMFQYYRHGGMDDKNSIGEGWLHTSSDGIHWSVPVKTTMVGDNTSFFYNPFRRKWCMSIRRNIKSKKTNERLPIGLRTRFYKESDDFITGANWDIEKSEFLWQVCDNLDRPDPSFPDHIVSLYDLTVSPYESLMLGVFAIFRGPENNICEEIGIPKIIDLELGYSRDGFHFSRPDRTSFLESSRKEGTWNRAYLHATGGLCLVVDDKLYFYFTGFSGSSPRLGKTDVGQPGRSRRVMYAGGSTGLATIRRDGFAFMHTTEYAGILVTRPLSFLGKYLFVNVACPEGELKVEVCDRDFRPIPGFTSAECVPVVEDSTCYRIRWARKESLESLKVQPVRFKFYLTRGRLYSFWVSQMETGESCGYVAAGGPGFVGAVDSTKV